MSAPSFFTPTGSMYAVEELIRYAASEFERVGLPFQHTKAAKLIRAELRSGNRDVRRLIDAWVDRADHAATWAGFELFAASGYKDPTAARALANVHREWAGAGR